MVCAITLSPYIILDLFYLLCSLICLLPCLISFIAFILFGGYAITPQHIFSPPTSSSCFLFYSIPFLFFFPLQCYVILPLALIVYRLALSIHLLFLYDYLLQPLFRSSANIPQGIPFYYIRLRNTSPYWVAYFFHL